MTTNQINRKNLELNKMRTCIRIQGKAISTERKAGAIRAQGVYYAHKKGD